MQAMRGRVRRSSTADHRPSATSSPVLHQFARHAAGKIDHAVARRRIGRSGRKSITARWRIASISPKKCAIAGAQRAHREDIAHLHVGKPKETAPGQGRPEKAVSKCGRRMRRRAPDRCASRAHENAPVESAGFFAFRTAQCVDVGCAFRMRTASRRAQRDCPCARPANARTGRCERQSSRLPSLTAPPHVRWSPPRACRLKRRGRA